MQVRVETGEMPCSSERRWRRVVKAGSRLHHGETAGEAGHEEPPVVCSLASVPPMGFTWVSMSGATITQGALSSGKGGAVRKDRILHVLNGLPFGGNETLCLQLLQSLAVDEKLLLNIGPDGGMRARLETVNGLQIWDILYTRARRWRFVMETWRFLRKLRPTGIVLYPFGVHVFVGIAARLAGVPSILVHAGNPPPEAGPHRRKWWLAVVASTLLRIPILSCSRYVHREFRILTRFIPDRSNPLPNGLDVEVVRERAERARAFRSHSGPVVGMVARLSRIKDQATLIRAWRTVVEEFPEARLWIVGEGETKDDLETIARHEGVIGSVVFWGKRSDIPELLGSFDVYVFSTTRDEGFGVAIVEAMAAGIPVVASDVPACREVLEDGEFGTLVPPGDADPLAREILRLLKDRHTRARWGAIAQGASPRYSIRKCADEWLTLLHGGRLT
jgi:glycosyltransferase involved in cell wall biosynthesis